MSKVFLPTPDQIRLLQRRNLGIDAQYATPILESENYYKLINGYKRPFLDPASSPGNEVYISGSNFSEIVALYEFDRTLRSIFFSYFLRIENNMKSLIAYEFSHHYGHDNYLKQITYFRNVCAHDERFYNYQGIPIGYSSVHAKMGIPQPPTNSNRFPGSKDLLSILIIFRALLDNAALMKIVAELDSAFTVLSNGLHSIHISSVQTEMGFPTNWTDVSIP